jgi:phage recombination protein Bet
MTTALATLTSKLAARLDMGDSSGLMETLKATAFKGQVSDAQMTALMIVANQYGLNPWTKEIYAFPDKNNGIVPVVGVDGWSRIINENAQFDGMDFEQDDESCTCIIYRKDRTRPVRITEYMSECKRGTGPWQSHPKRMLRHKAMIQCARLAFGYVGIYDQDEAERIVDMGVAQEVKKSPTEIAQRAAEAARPERTERHASIIASLETVARELGFEPFKEEWSKLPKDDRAAIGLRERDRIGALAGQPAPAATIVDADGVIENGARQPGADDE